MELLTISCQFRYSTRLLSLVLVSHPALKLVRCTTVDILCLCRGSYISTLNKIAVGDQRSGWVCETPSRLWFVRSRPQYMADTYGGYLNLFKARYSSISGANPDNTWKHCALDRLRIHAPYKRGLHASPRGSPWLCVGDLVGGSVPFVGALITS